MASSEPKEQTGLFPEMMHELLEAAETNNESDIISWNDEGFCFKVHKKEEFVDRILPRYFRLSQYKSFVRQLNLWGFACINEGKLKGYYRNAFFIRGRKEFCSGMVREKIKGTRRRRDPIKGSVLDKEVSSPDLSSGTASTSPLSSNATRSQPMGSSATSPPFFSHSPEFLALTMLGRADPQSIAPSSSNALFYPPVSVAAAAAGGSAVVPPPPSSLVVPISQSLSVVALDSNPHQQHQYPYPLASDPPLDATSRFMESVGLLRQTEPRMPFQQHQSYTTQELDEAPLVVQHRHPAAAAGIILGTSPADQQHYYRHDMGGRMGLRETFWGEEEQPQPQPQPNSHHTSGARSLFWNTALPVASSPDLLVRDGSVNQHPRSHQPHVASTAAAAAAAAAAALDPNSSATTTSPQQVVAQAMGAFVLPQQSDPHFQQEDVLASGASLSILQRLQHQILMRSQQSQQQLQEQQQRPPRMEIFQSGSQWTPTPFYGNTTTTTTNNNNNLVISHHEPPPPPLLQWRNYDQQHQNQHEHQHHHQHHGEDWFTSLEKNFFLEDNTNTTTNKKKETTTTATTTTTTTTATTTTTTATATSSGSSMSRTSTSVDGDASFSSMLGDSAAGGGGGDAGGGSSYLAAAAASSSSNNITTQEGQEYQEHHKDDDGHDDGHYDDPSNNILEPRPFSSQW